MAKVPITKNRMTIAKGIAMKQGSMVCAANACGITVKTYRSRLGAEHKQWALEGLYGLKVLAYESISEIVDGSKRVDASLKFLERFPIVDVDDTATITTGKTSIAEIQLKILAELSDD